MSDLLEKLNVLLRSSVNSFLSSQPDSTGQRSGPTSAGRLGKDIDAEIAGLRKQIETALAQEDAMQAKLDKSQRQIDDYDQQADAALSRNDDANARLLVQQMERHKQQAAMLKADLEQHRQATSEFIEHVNTLDAIRGDALHQKQEDLTVPLVVADITESQTDGAPILSDLLRNVRERVNDAVTPRSTPSDQVEPTPDNSKNSIKIAIGGSKQAPDASSKPDSKVETKADSKADSKHAPEEEDLAKRRSRLSKPD